MNQTELLLNKIVEGLQEKKGKDIATVNISHVDGAICQYIVICTGNTPTQVSALSDSVWEMVRKDLNEKPIAIDGERASEWIGLDYGTIIVHLFTPELRTYYDIENLWAGAKINLIPDLD